ncbi:MAG: hypothetical protein HQK62_09770 [Desulfamplus sp.]|nr:hypothetical protein [Desulfamplus sp.]
MSLNIILKNITNEKELFLYGMNGEGFINDLDNATAYVEIIEAYMGCALGVELLKEDIMVMEMDQDEVTELIERTNSKMNSLKFNAPACKEFKGLLEEMQKII